MKILYVATLGREQTARHRLMALRRIGHEVSAFDLEPYYSHGSRISRWLRYRAMIGPIIAGFNRDLIAAVGKDNFDLVWFDKAIFVWPKTVKAISELGAPTIHYNPDNPFGPRDDPGWHLFLKALPFYDVHVVPRRVNLVDYRAGGARKLILMPFAYEPTVHYPPPDGWTDKDRAYDVSFVGSPYDDRPDFIRALWRRHGIRVNVRGGRWDRAFTRKERELFYGGHAVYNESYRERIWRSKFSLGFVTHSNRDTLARRWFEITGSGGFLLAARTEDGLKCFAEGKEAVFFSDVDECASLIRRYLPDQAARAASARAGHERAVSSGYSNDARLKRVLAEI